MVNEIASPDFFKTLKSIAKRKVNDYWRRLIFMTRKKENFKLLPFAIIALSFVFNVGGYAQEKKSSEESKTPAIKPALDSGLVYKDEAGQPISQTEFLQKQARGKYLVEPDISEGKLIGMH